MNKICCALLAALFISCEYKDLSPKICYLASEQISSLYITYGYNEKNELISYSAPNIYSSVLTYDGGKIISELDNNQFQITYTYDNQNRITVWSETVQGYPQFNIQTKFFYNSFNQDTLQQYFKYDVSTSALYLWKYARRNFASTGNKNYSQSKTYDAATNTLLYTEDFEYDNHPNPYLANVFFQNSPPPSNNITSYKFTQPGFAPEISNYTYTYNSNGFPIYKLLPTTNIIVEQYTYTNCK